MDRTTTSELEAVAALAAATNAQVSQLNQDIVGESGSAGSIKFDAKDFLKGHLAQVGVPEVLPPPPPDQHPQVYVNPQDMIPQHVDTRWQLPAQVAPTQGYAQPLAPLQAHITLPPNVEARLDSIDEKLEIISQSLSKLADLENKVGKFVQRGLNNRVKQVTLKLDGPTDTK